MKKKEIVRLVNSRKRMFIAMDDNGIHFRETMCVIHDGTSGEAQYHAKPIGSLGSPRKFRTFLAKLIADWQENA